MSKISKTYWKNGEKWGKFVSVGGPFFCLHLVQHAQVSGSPQQFNQDPIPSHPLNESERYSKFKGCLLHTDKRV